MFNRDRNFILFTIFDITYLYFIIFADIKPIIEFTSINLKNML
jgi:hypothetical protein